MTKLAIVLTVLVAACGGSDSVSLQDFPQEFRDAFCHNFVKCGMVKDLDTCRKLNFPVNPYVTASGRAAIEMKKSDFDGDEARACVDALANSTCDVTGLVQRVLNLGPLPDACEAIFNGTLHNGDACALDVECRSLNCNVAPCNMACCTGACVGDNPPVLAKVGESCANANCVSAAYCDLATDTCAALKPMGAICASVFECQLDLVCIGTGARTCHKLAKLGEPCPEGFCQDLSATCSDTSHTCVKVAVGGDACATDNDCSLLYGCDPQSHLCSAGIALGGACTLQSACADARAFCDVAAGATTGTCALPKDDGMPCRSGAQCVSHTCTATAGTPGMCIPEPVCI